MALIVFLRGVNVGGHRTFRPSMLAKDLSQHDVVNVGAAGTFVVRKPGSRAKFRTALLQKLPFETEVVLCDGRDLLRVETENPFASEPATPDVVRQHPVESRRRPGLASSGLPVRGGVAGQSDRVAGTIRLRDVPPAREDDRLPWPDRQTVRWDSDDTELEHDNGGRAYFEKRDLSLDPRAGNVRTTVLLGLPIECYRGTLTGAPISSRNDPVAAPASESTKYSRPSSGAAVSAFSHENGLFAPTWLRCARSASSLCPT